MPLFGMSHAPLWNKSCPSLEGVMPLSGGICQWPVSNYISIRSAVLCRCRACTPRPSWSGTTRATSPCRASGTPTGAKFSSRTCCLSVFARWVVVLGCCVLVWMGRSGPLCTEKEHATNALAGPVDWGKPSGGAGAGRRLPARLICLTSRFMTSIPLLNQPFCNPMKIPPPCPWPPT